MGPSSVIDADPEQARLAVLRSYRIVDTPPESQFDNIVRLAADQCQAATAGLALVDEKRCWFKARVGVDRTEISRDLSFSNHAIRSSGIFVVTDARLDHRFSHLPVVLKDGFNFFAGMPLVTPQGHCIGALCVLDRQPREILPAQIAALKMLSKRAMDLFEQHRAKPVTSPVTSMPSVSTGDSKGGPGSVLIVDDDDAVRSFVCVACRRLGYQVWESPNGIEALSVLDKNPDKISLVLTDVNMPLMDGLELVKALKKLPAIPAIAVMSGRFDPYILSALRAEGITALLSKPFSTEELKQTLLRAKAARV